MLHDEELCRQIQAGDDTAMEALVHRYHGPIFAYLYRLLGHRPAAEDLTQETFVHLLTRIQTYRFPQPFRPWLYTIAHNLYRDYCKNAHQRSTVPAADTVHTPDPLDLSERIAERAEVTRALRSLDPPQREVLLLRYYQDLKIDEIARVVGAPPGTVKSRLFGAMQRLRALLQASDNEGRERRETAASRLDR